MTCLFMLLILMPGLACGPFMNASKAQAAQSMQGREDCHGMGMESSQKAPDHGSRVFFKDCSKTDLYSADHVSLQKPDLDGKVFFTAWTATIPHNSLALTGFRSIRGPPPDLPALSRTQPSILLTTQRLRI